MTAINKATTPGNIDDILAMRAQKARIRGHAKRVDAKKKQIKFKEMARICGYGLPAIYISIATIGFFGYWIHQIVSGG